MSELRSRTISVELRRDHAKRPWGLRITGGCDVEAPLIITRAQVGTPCDGVLKPGDKIRKIGDYDSRDIRHQDAQNLFHNAGTSIKLVVQRDTPVATVSGCSSRASSVGPSGTKSPLDSPYVMAKLNNAILDSAHSRSASVVSPYRQEIQEEIYAVTEQPYRTTPLVLPGAKVKKDAALTESYLRHHPNPAMRAPPPNTILLPHDVVMKHKVADSVIQRVVGEDPTGKQVVHKQFNSPIGLYSNDNIKDTIHSQTGITPNFKKTVVYDPAKSETYKALQEAELGDHIQEVTVPVQTKVFSPTKAATPKIRPQPNKKVNPSDKQVPKPAPYTHTHAPHPVPGPYAHHLNSLGVSSEEIQQSGSFKRLMYMVMNDN